jgi:hypothetical protein
MKLYVDMDGVLADFSKSARIEHNLKDSQNVMEYKLDIGKKKFWDKINENPDFWINIEPLPNDVVQVWKTLSDKFAHIAILSAPTYSNPMCIPNDFLPALKHGVSIFKGFSSSLDSNKLKFIKI